MTPAINALKKAGFKYEIHPYDHDSSTTAYGDEAVTKLNLSPNRVFKTLVVALDGNQLANAILPVSCQLDLKRYAKVAKVKRAAMADSKSVEKVTGYILGGVSPMGQKQRLPAIIDRSATEFETIFVSAGKRGLQVELAPDDLRTMTNGQFHDIGIR